MNGGIKLSKKDKNYHYVSDNAVVIITTDSESDAESILRDTVKEPSNFRLDNVVDIN